MKYGIPRVKKAGYNPNQRVISDMISTEARFREWEEAFEIIYGRSSLRSYKNWTCVKCRESYNALEHRGRCPHCQHQTILTNFLRKAAMQVEQFLEEEVYSAVVH